MMIPGRSYKAHWEVLGLFFIGLRPMPPHCSRDPAHGPGVGSGLLPRLPPPTCARPVSGVGLGPRCYTASLLWSHGPRPSPVFRSAICDCLSLHVSVSLIPGRYEQNVNALGCALCLLTTTAISRTGPMWARGFCPGSRRPRARVPSVVWAWGLFVMRLPCCGLPAPARRQFFALRSATVCHYTYLFSRLCLVAALCLSLFARLRVDAQLRSLGACRDVAVCHQFINEYCFCDRYRETRCVK
jgi:hypothetical protein